MNIIGFLAGLSFLIKVLLHQKLGKKYGKIIEIRHGIGSSYEIFTFYIDNVKEEDKTMRKAINYLYIYFIINILIIIIFINIFNK